MKKGAGLGCSGQMFWAFHDLSWDCMLFLYFPVLLAPLRSVKLLRVKVNWPWGPWMASCNQPTYTVPVTGQDVPLILTLHVWLLSGSLCIHLAWKGRWWRPCEPPLLNCKWKAFKNWWRIPWPVTYWSFCPTSSISLPWAGQSIKSIYLYNLWGAILLQSLLFMRSVMGCLQEHIPWLQNS